MLFHQYQSEDFFDEMFTDSGLSRPHYRGVEEAFREVGADEFRSKQAAVDAAFMRSGVTFTVYNDAQGTERIFPFDCVPRVISAEEWKVIEEGLIQRITALNLFLHDIYHGQKIIKDRVIPAQYVLSAKHFRREFMNFSVSVRTFCRMLSVSPLRWSSNSW